MRHDGSNGIQAAQGIQERHGLALAVPPDVELRMRVEEMRAMYDQTLSGIWSVIAVGIAVSVFLLPFTDRLILLSWLGSAISLSVARTFIVLRYRNSPLSEIDPVRWIRLCTWPHLVAAFVWGVGGVLVMPKDSALHQSLLYFFLSGLSAGSSSYYAAQSSVKTWTLVLFVLPTSCWLLAYGQPSMMVMAAMGILLLMATIRGALMQSNRLLHSFYLTHQLEKAKAAAEHLAGTDALTGLSNRRAFFLQVSPILTRMQQLNRPTSVVMLDIDHFKKVNDTLGHAAGDCALQHLARLLASNLRSADICCRMGGEEFAVFLPGATIQDAIRVAEKIRQALERTPADFSGTLIQMTSSFGIGTAGENIDMLLQAADAALYRAKAEGRNRVVA